MIDTDVRVVVFKDRTRSAGKQKIIGVKKEYKIAARARIAGVEAAPLPDIHIEQHRGQRVGSAKNDRTRSIGRSIIDNDKFNGCVLRQNAVDRSPKKTLVIVTGNDDRKTGRIRGGAARRLIHHEPAPENAAGKNATATGRGPY